MDKRRLVEAAKLAYELLIDGNASDAMSALEGGLGNAVCDRILIRNGQDPIIWEKPRKAKRRVN